MPIPSPEPMDERGASLEASIRRKLGVGERLTQEERAFLAALPGVHGVSGADVREAAQDATR